LRAAPYGLSETLSAAAPTAGGSSEEFPMPPLRRPRRLVPALTTAVSLLAVAVVAVPYVAAAPAASDDPVVARIDGQELHRSDVEAAQRGLPQQIQQMPLETIYPMLLDQMVNGKLLSDAGRKEKLDQDPEVKKQLARVEDRVIQQAYIGKEVEKAATDDRLKAKYEQYVKDNPPKEEVNARHILVEKESDAKEIIAELNKGADFEKLAKEKSTDPAAQNGGDLGWFSRDEMVPEFSDAAFKLKKGEYTKEPVKTKFGYHVIKLEDRRMGQPPSFEEAKDELTNAIARDVITDRIKTLRQQAKVETFALDGSPMPAPGAAPAAGAPASAVAPAAAPAKKN
jgi:peptidyl-prolyl cis-trans isomerase C